MSDPMPMLTDARRAEEYGKKIDEQAARIAALEDAMRSMREHLVIQPSALAKALVATIDAALAQEDK
jgi:hypothetical protein